METVEDIVREMMGFQPASTCMEDREEPADAGSAPDDEQISAVDAHAKKGKHTALSDWGSQVDDKMDFSKKGMLLFEVIEVLLIIIACITVFVLGESTPIYWSITAIAAEAAIYSAMYMWKTKCLNRAKYAQKFFIELSEKYGPDTAIRVAEFVLRD